MNTDHTPRLDEPRGRRLDAAALVVLTALALALRTIGLGNTFQSSDNAELAARVVSYPGYLWMVRERYGVLIILVAKLFVGSASSLGVTVTEFWWKLPIALLGTLQVPLGLLFLKRVGCGRFGALCGAALLAVLPVHVMQSRYLWGYEVLGTLFLTLALWALLGFFERPTPRSGLVASLFSGLYLISHGYVIPFALCLPVMLILFARTEGEGVLATLRGWVKLLVRNLLWVFPLLFYPLYLHPLRHALGKPVRPGLFLADHGVGFVRNTGVVLALLLLGGVIALAAWRRARSRPAVLMAVCGGLYLAPLLVLAPPGVTVVRGYMLVGTCLLTLGAAAVLDRVAGPRKGLAVGLVGACFALTLWGTVESVFLRDGFSDPSLVKLERGDIPPDPGTKAAAYVVRKYAAPSARVLAIHRAVEPPNLVYYFGRREHAYYDLTLAQSLEKFAEMSGRADVVICEAGQIGAVAADGAFALQVVILSENRPRMWIYARVGVRLPPIRADAATLNRAFDAQYAPRVGLR